LLTLSTITSAQPGSVHTPALPPAGAATQAGLAGPAVVPTATTAAAATVAAPNLTRISGAPTGALTRALVEQASELVREIERRAVQLGAQRVTLNKRYLSELDAIDRLKNQRPAWRRDRELRDSLSSSFETANQLSAVDRESRQVNLKLLSARRAYLDAIDRELSIGPSATRLQELQRARAPLARQFTASARRIVLPDLEIDPLADPEELDQRVAELAASEAELNRLLAMLDRELERVGGPHARERANDAQAVTGEDPVREARPMRPSPRPAGFDAVLARYASSERVDAAPSGEPADQTETRGLEAATLESFAAAQRTSDPESGADAVHKARGAVAERLEQVKRRRAEIEARSKQLRGVP
jgi:hypothetical protein